MAKYCSKCGTQLSDSALFCANCGAPVAQPVAEPVVPQPVAQPVAEPVAVQPVVEPVAQQDAQPVVPQPVAEPVVCQPVAQPIASQPATQQVVPYTQPQAVKSSKIDFKKTIFSIGKFKVDLMKLLIAGGALVLALVLVVVLVFSANNPKSVAQKAVGACVDDFDADAILDLVHEDVVSIIANEEDMTVNQLRRECQEQFDKNKQRIEKAYDDYSVNWEVVDVRDASFSDLEDIQEKYLDYSYNLLVTDMKLAKVYVERTYVDDGDYDRDSDIEEFALVKIDGNWYVDFDYFF